MTGIDGYDWSIFGGNPVPGDPDGVRAIAVQLRGLADQAGVQRTVVSSVGSDSASIWSGPAADKFRPLVGQLPGQLDKMTTSYRIAGDALDGYWPVLNSAQNLAVQALYKARAARQALDAAQQAVSQAQGTADQASAAYDQAAMALAAHPSPSVSDTQKVNGLQASYQSARAQVGAANGELAAAQSQFQAAEQMRQQAVATARAGSSRCAAGLRSASSAGIHNPHHSFWGGLFDDTVGAAIHGAEDLGGWVEHNWKTVALDASGLGLAIDAGEWLSHNWVRVLHDASNVLGGITVVAGLLSLIPIVGEVALPVAMLAAGLQTVDDLTLAATGHGSWASVGFDAVGDVSFGVGDGLVRISQGLEELPGLTRTVEELPSTIAEAKGAIPELARNAEALRSFDSYTVPLLESGGTRWVKVADLADQADAGLLKQQGKVSDLTTSWQGASDRLEELKPLQGGEWPKVRYGLQSFNPTADETFIPKAAKFLKNPEDYVQTALDLRGDGYSVGKSFDAWGKAWGGEGKTYFRLAVGVGAGASGLGSYTTAQGVAGN